VTRTRKVVMAGSAGIVATGLALLYSPTTTPAATAALTGCERKTDGYVYVSGVARNPSDRTMSVEVVSMVSGANGQDIDTADAKVNDLGPNQERAFTSAVYDVGTGRSSVPTRLKHFTCRVISVEGE
jgi:hypothetical protein